MAFKLIEAAQARWRAVNAPPPGRTRARLMLTRGCGPATEPIFPGNDLDTPAFTWGTGTAGVLSFLRRLDRRDGARLWTTGWHLPA